MSNIEVKCHICGKMFSKRRGEFNRSERLGRKHYCSLRCSGKNNVQHLVDNPSGYPVWKHPNAGSKIDSLSPFRWHLRNMKARCKKSGRIYTITLQDLKNQWDKQQGRCPYTGWQLRNPSCMTKADSVRGSKKTLLTPDRASLDRIDSSKGYTPDNIEFVSVMAQFAKNKWSKQQLIDFCQAVAKNH